MNIRNIWVTVEDAIIVEYESWFKRSKKIREHYFNKKYKTDFEYFSTLYREYSNYVSKDNNTKTLLLYYKERYGNKKHLRVIVDDLNPLIKFHNSLKKRKEKCCCYLPKMLLLINNFRELKTEEENDKN